MDGTEPSAARPSAGGLFHSLATLLHTIIAFAQTRLELFSTELQEEVHRAAAILLSAFIALLAAGIGLLFVGATIIIVFWDTYRITAALCVTGAFLLIALAAIVRIRMAVHSKPRMFDATRSELKKDADQLEARL
jgi:uncharacterized membrane protein YqjE